jgi:sterol 14-demethylase
MMGFRIVVDDDLCQGHGVCESEAPELFEVNRERKVELLDATPSDDRRRAAELAVKYCPTHALSIVDDD